MNSLNCECDHLDELAVVDMGEHENVFRTLERVRTRGLPWWWLYASTCRACNQTWLVAQEERQNDIFILRRLDVETAGKLLRDGIWPTELDQYETLLQIGRDTGRAVRFADIADSSLSYTIVDLAQARPGIRVSELASLLNIEPAIAAKLARQATGISVTYDVE